MGTDETRSPGGAGPVVPWTWLTFGLGMVAAAAVTTLAVIVSVKDVDVLSTIALALAVLAFAAQLIVSLAQARSASEQLNMSERINAETQAALMEVRASAKALLANQTNQFDKVLSAALRSATESAVLETNADQLDPEAVADRIEANLRRYMDDHRTGP